MCYNTSKGGVSMGSGENKNTFSGFRGKVRSSFSKFKKSKIGIVCKWALRWLAAAAKSPGGKRAQAGQGRAPPVHPSGTTAA